MQVATTILSATIELDPPVDLGTVSGKITLDEGRAPYVEARVTVSLPDESTVTAIDPRDGLRVTLVAEKEWEQPVHAPQIRTFDLYLHEVEADYESGVLRLVAVSDEALLIDGGNATDESQYDSSLSLRSAVGNVLGLVGGFLQDPPSDEYEFYTDNINLVPNPKLDSLATGWTGAAIGGTASFARATTTPPTGFTAYGRVTATNALNTNLDVRFADASPFLVGIEAGKPVHVSATVRQSGPGTPRFYVQFRDAAGVIIETQSRTSILSTPPSNTWFGAGTGSAFTAPIIAPEGAVAVMIIVRRQLTSGTIANGSTWDVTGLIVSQNSIDTGYFDGDTADTANYRYDWTGTPEASSSTRTALLNRADDAAFILEPGETYWDFLNPLIQAAGLRLFCDEQREWRLCGPDYSVAGTITIEEGVNVVNGTDLRSLQATRPDGSPVFFTGCVVTYEWTDADGLSHTRADAAGTGTKIHHIRVRRPYPGPGAAAAILARAEGRGHTQTLGALTDLDTTPGMDLVSDLPAAPELEGVVSAVTWSWAAEGDDHDVMTVVARDLVEP